jgi:hypothetical protein
MTNTVAITCRIGTTDAAVGTADAAASLGFEAWIDDLKFFDSDHVAGSESIFVEIDDSEAEHELRFVLKNKTAEHTQIDSDGNIVKDVRLVLTDLTFDGIALGQLVTDHAVYTHDFNGAQQPTEQKFYSEMGCNGVVSLKFATPVYMWLLEHM